MFVAQHNISDIKGDLIAAGTHSLKPEGLGEKEVLDRYLELGAIRKMTAEEIEEAKSVIVTGEVDDKQQKKAETVAVKDK
jgi:hypothetical protein